MPQKLSLGVKFAFMLKDATSTGSCNMGFTDNSG